MKKERKQSKETKKRADKALRLYSMQGVDLCACGPVNVLKCEGECRAEHRNEHGQIECGAKYQVDPDIFNLKKRRSKRRNDSDTEERPKRDWNKRRDNKRD